MDHHRQIHLGGDRGEHVDEHLGVGVGVGDDGHPGGDVLLGEEHPQQALLREHSVTRAAAPIGVSQPAMSSALKRLRRVLGDPLLVRAHGSYHLTPRARQLVRPLDDALRVIGEQVLHAVPFDPADSTRVFRIAASSSTAFAALRPVIAAAAQSYPDISFSIVAPTRWADQMFEDVDLDLVLLPEVLPSEQPLSASTRRSGSWSSRPIVPRWGMP